MTHSNKKINRLTPTNEDTIGPYYPISFCDGDSIDMTTTKNGIIFEPDGEKITVTGCVRDINGNLANGVLLEFWQANAKGVYRTPDNINDPDIDPWFTGYGRYRTPDGNFILKTIKPGKCGDRAPNITLTIFSDGIMRVVTQLFFENDPANDQDPLLQVVPEDLRERLMIKKAGKNEYSIEIIMAGENETPFFDDLLS